MFGINKILAPTDLSNLSLVGLRYAFNLARALSAEVIVYHVVDANELMHYRRLSTSSRRNRSNASSAFGCSGNREERAGQLSRQEPWRSSATRRDQRKGRDGRPGQEHC